MIAEILEILGTKMALMRINRNSCRANVSTVYDSKMAACIYNSVDESEDLNDSNIYVT
jgi:hypothetical protein